MSLDAVFDLTIAPDVDPGGAAAAQGAIDDRIAALAGASGAGDEVSVSLGGPAPTQISIQLLFVAMSRLQAQGQKIRLCPDASAIAQRIRRATAE